MQHSFLLIHFTFKTRHESLDDFQFAIEMTIQASLRQIEPFTDVADRQIADAAFRYQMQRRIHDLILSWCQFLLHIPCLFGLG